MSDETMTAAARDGVISTLDVLLAARKLIERPENWCQRPSDETHFCAMGALGKIAEGSDLLWMAQDALYGALPAGRETGIANFNDTHSHTEVIALFDRAIDAERANAAGAPMTDDPITGTAVA